MPDRIALLQVAGAIEALIIVGLLAWVVALRGKLRYARHKRIQAEQDLKIQMRWAEELRNTPPASHASYGTPMRQSPKSAGTLTEPGHEELPSRGLAPEPKAPAQELPILYADNEPHQIVPTNEIYQTEAAPARTVPVAEFSEHLAVTAFRNWCQAGMRPRSDTAMEVGFLQYARPETSSVVGAPSRHVLRDSPQIAEFVRFSGIGATEALVFPTPDAHFTPVMNYLFPSINANALDNSVLIAHTRPVHVRRKSVSEWETYA